MSEKPAQPSRSFEASKGEQREKPRFSVDFYMSPHGTIEQMRKMFEIVKNYDVYIPEAADWVPASLDRKNKISEGKMKPSFRGEPQTIDDMEERALYNSKVVVAYVDIPASYKMKNARRLEEIMEDEVEALYAFINGRFEEAVTLEKELLVETAESIKERENYIISHMEVLLKDFRSRYPALRKKNQVKILAQLGTVHTNVPNILERGQKEVAVRKIFGEKINVFSLDSEAARALRSGNNDSKYTSDSWVAQMMAGVLISEILTDKVAGLSHGEITRLARYLAQTLAIDDLRRLSVDLGQAGAAAQSNTGQFIQNKIRRLGIVIPQTADEARQMIQKLSKNPF